MTINNAMRAECADAHAVAKGLHDAAQACSPDQLALKTRLLSGAATIERLCRLLERESLRLSLRVPQ
jgi:hypothetical protein